MLGLEILLGEFYFRNSFKRNPIYQKCIHQLRQYFHSNLLSFFCPKTIILFLFILKKIKHYENLCFLTKGLLRMRTLSIKQLIDKSNNKSISEKENHDALQFYWVYKKSILRYSDTVGNRSCST